MFMAILITPTATRGSEGWRSSEKTMPLDNLTSPTGAHRGKVHALTLPLSPPATNSPPSRLKAMEPIPPSPESKEELLTCMRYPKFRCQILTSPLFNPATRCSPSGWKQRAFTLLSHSSDSRYELGLTRHSLTFPSLEPEAR